MMRRNLKTACQYSVQHNSNSLVPVLFCAGRHDFQTVTFYKGSWTSKNTSKRIFGESNENKSEASRLKIYKEKSR